MRWLQKSVLNVSNDKPAPPAVRCGINGKGRPIKAFMNCSRHFRSFFIWCNIYRLSTGTLSASPIIPSTRQFLMGQQAVQDLPLRVPKLPTWIMQARYSDTARNKGNIYAVPRAVLPQQPLVCLLSGILAIYPSIAETALLDRLGCCFAR
jgi:hypothetical protein